MGIVLLSDSEHTVCACLKAHFHAVELFYHLDSVMCSHIEPISQYLH